MPDLIIITLAAILFLAWLKMYRKARLYEQKYKCERVRSAEFKGRADEAEIQSNKTYRAACAALREDKILEANVIE